MGGPFHGYASDDTNQTRVQIGPLADFNVPDGLSARSLNNRIPSGGSAGLEASLLLDDGTRTILDPSVVEWTFSKPELKFQNGALLAEVMPNRTLKYFSKYRIPLPSPGTLQYQLYFLFFQQIRI